MGLELTYFESESNNGTTDPPRSLTCKNAMEFISCRILIKFTVENQIKKVFEHIINNSLENPNKIFDKMTKTFYSIQFSG